MTSDQVKALAGWLLASIVGGLLAITFGWVTRPAERTQAIAPGAEAGDRELVAQLAELSRQIEALRGFLASRAPSSSDLPQPVRVPVGETELGQWMEDLRALTRALQEQGARAVGSEVSIREMATWMPARGREPLFVPLVNYRDDEFDWTAAEQSVTKEHLLWSVEELVRHYGKPDEVNGFNANGLVLGYKDAQTGISVRFQTKDGLVHTARLEN